MTLRIPFAALAASIVLCGITPAAPARPNILFILVDDQRNDELGCAGDALIRTPNIDRLAARGVRFENMFVTTSICAASRASIFTGLTERSHGFTFGTPPIRQADIVTSYPALLKKAGYRTGFFGKFGVNLEGAKRFQAAAAMFDRFERLHRSPFFKKQPDGSKRHVDEIVGDRAVAFLQSQPKDQPFCLSMSFNIAHAEDNDKRPGVGHFPWPMAVDGQYEESKMPLPRLRDPEIFNAMPGFMKKSLNRERYFWRWDTPEKYAANIRARFRMLTGMDGVVGRVLKALEKHDMAENTVVIYTADNGYYRAERGFAGKWSHFEESLRVPLIICDPRVPKDGRGKLVRAMALNIDLTATMLELAGLDIPAKYQGRSLKPFVDGSAPAKWRTDFFCEHLMNHKPIPKWEGVRDQRYVYARYFEQEPAYEFLHDLEKDPDELQNLAGKDSHADVLEDMRVRCAAYVERYRRPDNRPKPASPRRKSAGKSVKPDAQGVYSFDGTGYAALRNTRALGVDDSCTWAMDVRALPGTSAGGVLMGNRVTPGLPDLNFMKITAERGVQFYGGSRAKTLKLDCKLPKNRWANVLVRKSGRRVSVSVDGKKQAEGNMPFALPSMPCYLGGDPNTAEMACCEIRNASVTHGE
jgi:arylsulfatase A-like enzyme